MSREVINVPGLGGAESVEVIEVAIAVGDAIDVDDTLVVLESDKASMDVPSPRAGEVVAVLVKEGDSLSEGDAILELQVAGASETEEPEPTPATGQGAETASPETVSPGTESLETLATVVVPDIGSEGEVDVVEVAVAVGDTVSKGDSLLVLESDKSSVEVPSPFDGEVREILVREGARVSRGAAILRLLTTGAAEASAAPQTPRSGAKPVAPVAPPPSLAPASAAAANASPAAGTDVYAGPAVRRLARELGVDLARVSGTGPRNRIRKDDVHNFVKQALQGGSAAAPPGGVPVVPDMDFSQFGGVEEIGLSRIARVTAGNMTRNWLNVPAVTHFDDADITELEAFRESLKTEAEQRGARLTPMPFLVMACARALLANPVFNRAWHSSGEKVIQKRYVHIGMAVDTPRGLLVPVIRDADKKGLWELAEEISGLAAKARGGKLSAAEMQGGCFSISSLGALGGAGFTPIVNSPEAAILAVSKAAIKPVWNGAEFVPRRMLPLSLTYDHRLINGGDAGRFMTFLVGVIGDIRRILL